MTKILEILERIPFFLITSKLGDGGHVKPCREKDLQDFEQEKIILVELLVQRFEQVPIKILLIESKEVALFEIGQVSHAQNLLFILKLVHLISVLDYFVRISEYVSEYVFTLIRGVFEQVVVPVYQKDKGNVVQILPCKFVLDVLLFQIPELVIVFHLI